MSKELDPNIEALSNEDHTVVQKNPKKRWQSYLWDTLDKSPEERHFVFKLDLALLTFGCLGFFAKFLDQANVNNAFVSGMKEDLGMFGNELNYVTTCWTVGYIVGEIPSNILLTRIRPSIWIPSCMVVWTVLTFCIAACKTTTQLYVLRVFIGLAEAGFYPGMQFMIGSWYRKDEISKRSCILNASGSAAQMFSGYLMAAVIGLNGRNGLPGWKWLFIMDGVISLPIAIGSFFFLPDHPDTTRAWYLTKEDVALAKKRMSLEGRAPRKAYTKAHVKKILTSWHLWGLSILYMLNGTTGGTPVFAQYLKASKHPVYSVQQINTYPTTANALQVASALAYSWISDSILGGRRWPIILFSSSLSCAVYASLAAWNIAEGWHWACYVLIGQGVGMTGIQLAWANEVCSGDAEERAIVLASMNQMTQVINAWLPLIVWQQIEAPQYQKGFITASCMSGTLIIWVMVVRFLQKRDALRKSQEVEEVTEITDRTSDEPSSVHREDKATEIAV